MTLHVIARMAALRDLDLADSDALDDAGLLPLRGLGALRALSLARCRWIGDAACATLAQVRRAGAGCCERCAAVCRLPGSGCQAQGAARIPALPRRDSAAMSLGLCSCRRHAPAPLDSISDHDARGARPVSH